MLGFPTHNRLDLLKKSLESLLLSDVDQILIVDDASDKYTWTYLDWMRDKHYARIRLQRGEQRMGADLRMFYLCESMSQDSDYFVLSGSDIIYSQNFYSRLVAAFKKYPESAIIGGFNGTNHQRNIAARLDNDLKLNEVGSITGPVLINSAFWHEYSEQIDPYNHDVSMANIAFQKGWLIACFEHSLVQHIGILDGLHLHAPDIGIKFVGQMNELEPLWSVPRKHEGKIVERWLHNGQTKIDLYEDGTAQFGRDFAHWERESGNIIIHDPTWSCYLNVTGDTYEGKAYPVGTQVAGYNIFGRRLI